MSSYYEKILVSNLSTARTLYKVKAHLNIEDTNKQINIRKRANIKHVEMYYIHMNIYTQYNTIFKKTGDISYKTH